MKLSLVLISSYKSWQANKDTCTLLYFHKRLAWKKNLRHVISFSFFFFPCLTLSQSEPNPAAPPRAERKVVWQRARVRCCRADRGRSWRSSTSCVHGDRPQPPPAPAILLPERPQTGAVVPPSLPLERCHATSPSSTNLIWIGCGHAITFLSN